MKTDKKKFKKNIWQVRREWVEETAPKYTNKNSGK